MLGDDEVVKYTLIYNSSIDKIMHSADWALKIYIYHDCSWACKKSQQWKFAKGNYKMKACEI